MGTAIKLYVEFGNSLCKSGAISSQMLKRHSMSLLLSDSYVIYLYPVIC